MSYSDEEVEAEVIIPMPAYRVRFSDMTPELQEKAIRSKFRVS